METSWINGLIGGVLIGISATILLAFNGRIAGISGMINGALEFKASQLWRWYFLGGMLLGGLLFEYVLPFPDTPRYPFHPTAMLVGGFLVGWGTTMANGCTSGHGVCGLGRLSLRSLVAVITFLITGILTVFVTRHLLA
ncbi:MAG: YeeE/YedE thiosulfate transporter family protein [Geminocystis sp.]|nr:YeeE/YedE thiosulfate transporter family protein [Geminocystis sp.]MCS7148742.1 YeeE/YedE thiosulfate transporter family protein [Geminocystis sp.]MCX8078384.1 YeeE/YedE thiosulfate transporter family protein [Geminocystis sp.]MDW8116109.1 YeeE/YedE thiosulfate transporter family protein [Geminocystis sp.]MDW8463551.1 YeeE/YedE thiosulfate transporter family protein [Geminocystis sp.]